NNLSDTGGTMFLFDNIVQPGVAYRLIYYIDTDANGRCETTNDTTGEVEFFIDSSTTLLKVDSYIWKASQSDVCSSFRSRDEICESHCNTEQTCNLAERSKDDCLLSCNNT